MSLHSIIHWFIMYNDEDGDQIEVGCITADSVKEAIKKVPKFLHADEMPHPGDTVYAMPCICNFMEHEPNDSEEAYIFTFTVDEKGVIV